MHRARLFLSVVITIVAACGAEQRDDGPDRDVAEAPAVEADPLVGYDLRRLRPREGETLAAMFDRMHQQAIGEGKRVLVLFSADWCEPCKRLDLELGNSHPASMIGDVRILEVKEDDWKAAARMDELDGLRRRWEPALGTYPLAVLVDAEGKRVDEMKQARDRLEAQGVSATLPVWLESTRPTPAG